MSRSVTRLRRTRADSALEALEALDTVGSVDAVDALGMDAVIDDFCATVTGEFSAEAILRQLAEAATRVLRIDGAGVMAPAEDQEDQLLRFVWATTEITRHVDRLQEVLRTGPCHASFLSGHDVNIADLAVEGDWPEFQQRAVEGGLRAVASIPLLARGRAWGVLDLYRAAPMLFSAAEMTAARRLANLASSYLVVTADRDLAREAQRQLADRAMHDLLTGLPVRWVFLEQLGHALARLHRRRGRVAVLFLDIDGLKYVNDTFGHAAGDRLLQVSVERVRRALRPADVLARIGGDEFVLLLEDIADDQSCAVVAQRILDELATPYRPDGQVMHPSASIGYAVTTSPATTAEALIAYADAAMYEAKRDGGRRFQGFDASRFNAGRDRRAAADDLIAALRTALCDGQLLLHYQPIFDVGDLAARAPHRSRPLWGVEALLRWEHPQRGLLAAAEFIEAAERSELIHEIGTFVLTAACTQLAAWDRDLGAAAPRQLFVNLSAAEVGDPLLVDRVSAALHVTGLPPTRLVLEVTETNLFAQPKAAQRSLAALQALGCGMAIDDFGTGYSSLSRLVDIPASTIKIDKSFTRALGARADASGVIAAVQTLGHNLRRTVVVEGVEDAATLQALLELGCTHLQGYHLARPAAAADVWRRPAPEPAVPGG